MASVADLRVKQEAVIRAMQELQRQGVASTTDERWQKASADLREIDAQMEMAVELENLEKRLLAVQDATNRAQGQPSGESREMSYEEVFERFLVMPQNGRLRDDELRILDAHTRGTNTQIGSTDSLGGYLVPQSFSQMLELKGLWSGGMFQACTVEDDPIGGTLKWPTADDTGTTGEISTQGASRTVQDVTFGNVLFSDYTIDSGIVKVSRELINDNRIPMLMNVLSGLLADRINRKANTVLTTGTGTSQPYGLTTAVTTSGATTASATAITKAELVKLLYSVDRYYTGSTKAAWMMHSTSLGYLRSLDFSTDTTHLFADRVAAGEPEMLLGYPVYVNNDLPAMTSGVPITANKHIWFGDFSKYVIRRIAGVSIERNDSVYWDKFTAGFMGWTRLDGNLIMSGAIKYLLQA